MSSFIYQYHSSITQQYITHQYHLSINFQIDSWLKVRQDSQQELSRTEGLHETHLNRRYFLVDMHYLRASVFFWGGQGDLYF